MWIVWRLQTGHLFYRYDSSHRWINKTLIFFHRIFLLCIYTRFVTTAVYVTLNTVNRNKFASTHHCRRQNKFNQIIKSIEVVICGDICLCRWIRLLDWLTYSPSINPRSNSSWIHNTIYLFLHECKAITSDTCRIRSFQCKHEISKSKTTTISYKNINYFQFCLILATRKSFFFFFPTYKKHWRRENKKARKTFVDFSKRPSLRVKNVTNNKEKS